MSIRTAESTASSLVQASPGRAFERFVSHAFRLRGRASRSEYWWWMLTNVAVLGVCQFVMPAVISGRTPNPTLHLGPFGSLFAADIRLFTVTATESPSSPLAAFFLICAGIWMVATLIPGVTVLVRRLHDSNMSGWWALLVALPIGSFLLLAFAMRGPRPEGARFDAE
ncbi:DUF805 domain-containing protein [Microbacterium sp. G2-8]|uniref:DUF805 domain-containing protein n=1 Tax=Microbacterium sp. G2-8 TaxID=2842454 RepID=UPI001C890E3F|nr:DUF805 domain-containing protein [Microbacterium sp. G2-8]